MGEVHKFEPKSISSDFRFDADEKLEKAKGEKLATLLILGEYDDGDLYIAGNANAGESLVLMEKVKRKLVFGDG